MDISVARAAMPVTEKCIYLDHASMGPLAGPARDVMAEALIDTSERGSASHAKWEERGQRGRSIFAELIGAGEDEVAYVRNTSNGLIIAANGLPLTEGDSIVIAHGEFPANVYPWLSLERKGVSIRFVQPIDRRITPDVIRSGIDHTTKAVALSFVQFSSGFRADLQAIGEMCRERGIFLVVDMIQGAGVMPLDFSQLPVDMAAVTGHKWMLGPEGLGFLYCRRELLDQLEPTHVGWLSVEHSHDFTNYEMRLLSGARRYEEGTAQIIPRLGLSASVEMLSEWTTDWISERLLGLTDVVIEEARRHRLRILSPVERVEERSGIVVVKAEGADHTKLAYSLLERGVTISPRGGGLRFAPHAYNTGDEVRHAFTVLAELLG